MPTACAAASSSDQREQLFQSQWLIPVREALLRPARLFASSDMAECAKSVLDCATQYLS